MILPAAQFHQLFHGSKEETFRSEEKKFTIFVSTLEADSACACRILEAILTAENIHYSFVPVQTFEDICTACEQQCGNSEELQTLIFINCGATVQHLREYIRVTDSVRMVVVDSHRPVHRDYISAADDTVIVVDEDDPGWTSIQAYNQAQDDDSMAEDGPARQRRRLNPGTADVPNSNGNMGSDAGARLYHSCGSYYGKPAALLMYDLAHRLQLDDNRLLWWGIVGATDQLIHQRCTDSDYAKWYDQLEAKAAAAGNLERSDQVTNAEGMIVRRPHATIKITPTKDLRLPLLRHWTVLESLINSPYVASRLQTWREKGKHYINLMLAKMGVSHTDAKIPFSAMKPYIQQSFAAKLKEHAHKFNINFDQLEFRSFGLSLGHDLRITAADCAYAVSALIAAPETEDLTSNAMFLRGYGVLDVEQEGTEFLMMGIAAAKQLQQATIRDVGLALGRQGQLVAVRKHNMVVVDLERLQAKQKRLFRHPLALTQMALFLRDARQFMDANGNGWGVLVAGADPNSHAQGPDERVAGIRCAVALPAKHVWNVRGLQGNPFGEMLPKVQEHCSNTTEISFSDPAIIRIKDPSMDKVIAALKNIDVMVAPSKTSQQAAAEDDDDLEL